MRSVAAAFSRLNPEQKEAVVHDGNTVVLAGPGSGKTATLVLKVAHLLGSVVQGPRGVACLTFNNDAVDEFRGRLAEHGIHADRRLYLGSVHSFCLNCIIRPYGRIVDPSFGQQVQVASEKEAESLLEKIGTDNIPNFYMPSFGSRATKMRRAIACGERTSGFDDRELAVVAEYDRTLVKRGIIDFEAMVLRSVELVRKHAWIRRLIAARFPWLVVDEYQDLGGPLHLIVTMLADLAGVKVFAVGDPDQTVYDFTGASPRYLSELGNRSDVKSIQLRLNYRSGGDLIIAGQAALAHADGPRPYEPDPTRTDPGRVIFKRAQESLADHGRVALTAVQEALAAGTEPHEIAVLYRSKNELLADIKTAFDEGGIAYTAERDRTYAKSAVVRWLQQCAGWAISPAATREHSFSDLLRFYGMILAAGGLAPTFGPDLRQRAAFRGALRDLDPEASLGAWLASVDKGIGLRAALGASRAGAKDDLEEFDTLSKKAMTGEFRTHRIQDFADDGRARGKVVLTTLHASKGRQFDVVILPGLVEGVMPKRNWNRRNKVWEELGDVALRETRRLFYVGFTRARHVVYLVYGNGFTHKGFVNKWGPSRFAKEIQERLK